MKKGSSNLLLPDVNVLIGLAWPNHQFHAVAVRTLAASTDRWATCALTQLGFKKILGNKQVTEAYLLALARHYNATFVTFDKKLKDLAGPETRIQIVGG